MAALLASRLMLVLLAWISLGLVAAYITDNRQHFKTVRRSKFVGLKLMCQLNPRNCPGGYHKAEKRLVEVNEGEALSPAQLPRAPVVLSPLSQLLQQAARPPLMGIRMGEADGDDVDEREGRVRLRLVVPIRDAIVSLLRRHHDVFPSGR